MLLQGSVCKKKDGLSPPIKYKNCYLNNFKNNVSLLINSIKAKLN